MVTQKSEYICRSDASRYIREIFPNHSAMVFCQVFKDDRIRTVFAGTMELISSSELHRWIEAIRNSNAKTYLPEGAVQQQNKKLC